MDPHRLHRDHRMPTGLFRMGYATRSAAKSYPRRHNQRVLDPVMTRGQIADRAFCFGSVQGSLKGRRVIDGTIAYCAVIFYVDSSYLFSP